MRWLYARTGYIYIYSGLERVWDLYSNKEDEVLNEVRYELMFSHTRNVIYKTITQTRMVSFIEFAYCAHRI